MNTTSNRNDLSARVRSRMAADRQRIEEIAVSELRLRGDPPARAGPGCGAEPLKLSQRSHERARMR